MDPITCPLSYAAGLRRHSDLETLIGNLTALHVGVEVNDHLSDDDKAQTDPISDVLTELRKNLRDLGEELTAYEEESSTVRYWPKAERMNPDRGRVEVMVLGAGIASAAE